MELWHFPEYLFYWTIIYKDILQAHQKTPSGKGELNLWIWQLPEATAEAIIEAITSYLSGGKSG